MKITIITVAFNAASTIADTLRSVSSQTHEDIEHILIDGASTDATMELSGSTVGTSPSAYPNRIAGSMTR